jgi:phosphoribosyl 1,2-cyclic phosphodiesterase
LARLCPLFSGSSGNSYYIGSAAEGILVDAGRSARQLTQMLQSLEIDPMAVQGILVTHEHVDHVRGLRVFASKYNIPVYATAGTLQALQEQGIANGSFACTAHGMQPFACAGFEVTPFATSHDCAESCGYRIRYPDGRTLVVATDLGYLSEEVKSAVSGCDFAVIESNHDVDMLRYGSYPYPLKKRILSDRGHLSNEACANFLPELAKSGTTRFMLAHLSRENNRPALAYQCAEQHMAAAGLQRQVDYLLGVAPVENTEGRTVLF